MSRQVLVVDDEASIRHVLTVLLQDRGYEVRAVDDGQTAIAELERRPYQVVITDVRMPEVGGLELLAACRERWPDVTVIVMSAYGSNETAIEAMKQGAYDYISKPFKPDEVALLLRKAEEREVLRSENARLRAELARVQEQTAIEGIVGSAPALEVILRRLHKVAEHTTTVLITGESGTGKELIARAIHEQSPRAHAAFVPVNCGAIPGALMESELFGHVKGAFTDASSDRPGLVVGADGGTLFLDEVGELPTTTQVKLLRFLQEQEIRPVGSSETRRVDVRVIAATSRDLEAEVAAGNFREDLYYRLNVVPLHLPPLRERSEDIPALVEHFIARLSARLGQTPKAVDPEAMARLEAYPWPGNIRELENTLEQLLVLAEGDTLVASDLPEKLTRTPVMDWSVLPDTLSIKQASKHLEAELIRRALTQTGGNRTRAAELLEISHRALLYKIKDYDIDL